MNDNSIESVLVENRSFPPPDGFARRLPMPRARALHEHAARDPEGFWAEQARSRLVWHQPFTQTLDATRRARTTAGSPTASSTSRGTASTCSWQSGAIAPRSSSRPRAVRVRRLTYGELHAEVCRFANALRALGAQAGDRVVIYMPLVPEAIIAMHACARIGAIHSVVFGGFSALSLRDRIEDAGARFVITADGGWRGGKVGRAEGRDRQGAGRRLPRASST